MVSWMLAQCPLEVVKLTTFPRRTCGTTTELIGGRIRGILHSEAHCPNRKAMRNRTLYSGIRMNNNRCTELMIPAIVSLPSFPFVIHQIEITPDHRRPRSLCFDFFLGQFDLGLSLPLGNTERYRLAVEF
jgi:hypothetical protein